MKQINNKNFLKNVDKVICGDSLKILKEFPDNCIDLTITSPPYFQQREYGGPGLGNECTVEEYIENLINIFNECVRVTKETGTIVFNLGDKYINGGLLLIPYKFALEVLKNKNIFLVNEISWIKFNPAPKQHSNKLIQSKEPFFLFAKSKSYYFNKDSFMDFQDRLLKNGKKTNGKDIGKKYFNLIETSSLSKEQKEMAKLSLNEVIREVHEGKIESFRMKLKNIHALPYGGQAGGRYNQIMNNGFTIIKIYGNSLKKDLIESNVETIKGNIHPAVYPEFVIQELIKLLSKESDIVLDPFLGSGTTAVVASKLKRHYIGIDIYQEYIDYALNRISSIKENNNYEIFI